MRKFYFAGALFAVLNFAQATTINAPAGLIGKNALSQNYAYLWTAPVAAQDITSATITFTGVVKTGGHGGGINVDFGSFLGMAVGQSSVPTSGNFGKIKEKDDRADFFGANVTAGKASNLGFKNFPSLKTPQTWSYTFTASQLAALNSYIANGNWGFEIDPDGKFSVGGISFAYTSEITGTKPVGVVATVPDSPTTFGLLGASVLFLMAVRRNGYASR
jgi:hypothetical protein